MSARPSILFPLFGTLERLSGIGPKTVKLLAGIGMQAPRDLLFTLPHTGVDRHLQSTIHGISPPQVVTVAVTIKAHRPSRSRAGAYRIEVEDAQSTFQLVYFHARGDYLAKTLPTGSRRVVSGKLEIFDNIAQMVHPDYALPEDEAQEIPSYEPIYPLTSGVTQKLMFKATRGALERVPKLAEWIDPSQKTKEGWPDFDVALQEAHRPKTHADIAPNTPARARLAYDEFMAHQLTLALARQNMRQSKGRATMATKVLQNKVLEDFPYALTSAQTRAIAEISADMAGSERMNRLLQGDVGAGKTLVAFMALLCAVEGGGQGVMMAPTEILARQHLEGLLPLAKTAGVGIEILTGRDKGKERKAKLAALARGDIQILLGTHAVFQADEK